MREEVSNSTPEKPQKPESKIIDLLIEALLDKYSPTGEIDKADFKSTLDLVDEMEHVAPLAKSDVMTAMELAGFKPVYTDAGFLWQLFQRA